MKDSELKNGFVFSLFAGAFFFSIGVIGNVDAFKLLGLLSWLASALTIMEMTAI